MFYNVVVQNVGLEDEWKNLLADEEATLTFKIFDILHLEPKLIISEWLGIYFKLF